MQDFLIRQVPEAIRRNAGLLNPPPEMLAGAGPRHESILYAFYFSGCPWQEGQRILKIAATRARYLYLADFCIAERNLELAPELVARMFFGRRRQFWIRGGLGNFVLESGLRLLERRPIMSRMAQLMRLGPFCR